MDRAHNALVFLSRRVLGRVSNSDLGISSVITSLVLSHERIERSNSYREVLLFNCNGQLFRSN